MFLWTFTKRNYKLIGYFNDCYVSYYEYHSKLVVDLLGFSLLLVWLELVVVALSVDRSLEARAERSRGSTGTSSTSGEEANASHVQPSARAADHTANTNVSIVRLSCDTPCPSPTSSTQTFSWPIHLLQFTHSCLCTVTWNQSLVMHQKQNNIIHHTTRDPRAVWCAVHALTLPLLFVYWD